MYLVGIVDVYECPLLCGACILVCAQLFCTVMTGWMSTLCSPSNRGKWEGLGEVLCALFYSRETHDELFPLYYFVKQKISEGDSLALNSALEWMQVCGVEEGGGGGVVGGGVGRWEG